MTFSVTHLDGTMEQPHGVSGLPALLDELRDATPEHGDVAVSHESGWTLTVMASGRVVWENIEQGGAPGHMGGPSREETLELMRLVASGEIGPVRSRRWVPGYGVQ
jgi:hypothetical protein